MTQPQPLHTLTQVLERMASAGDGKSDISVQDILDAFGQRSFGPLLLLPSLLVVSPLSGIPGVPTMMALIVTLVAVQLLLDHTHLWLPPFVLRRSISYAGMHRALRWLGPLAASTDRLIYPRLAFLTRGPFSRVIAVICILISLTMPPLEMVPLANSVTAAAIATFGLALTARDGLLAIIAFAIPGIAAWLALSALLG